MIQDSNNYVKEPNSREQPELHYYYSTHFIPSLEYLLEVKANSAKYTTKSIKIELSIQALVESYNNFRNLLEVA